MILIWATLSLALQSATLAECYLLRKNRDILFPRKRRPIKRRKL